MMSVVSSSVPPAAAALSIATCAVLIVRVGLAICGTPGVKDIDVAFVVRRDLPLSASNKKIVFFWNSTCAFGSFFIPAFDPSSPRRAGSLGRSAELIRGIGVFVAFALPKQ